MNVELQPEFPHRTRRLPSREHSEAPNAQPRKHFPRQYVELHCHSAYSFLDGASHPEELAGAAAELGYEALALTDHDGLHGAMELAQAARPLGVRPISGAELTLDDGSHLTLLCETRAGWSNLCRLVTCAHASTRRWAR